MKQRSAVAVVLSALIVAVLVSIPWAILAEAEEKTGYTLVYLKTGPKSGQLPEADSKAAFAGHFANIGKLAQERKLLVAGPFGKERHDPALRGIFILKAQGEEAKTQAATDPAVMAEVFVLEFHDIRTDKDLAGALERYFELEAKAKAEGRELKLEESMRSYVWLTAENGGEARRELQPLVEQGKVFLVADMGEKRLLALLDATSAEIARKDFETTLAKIGDHHLDEWYGSNQLAQR